MSEKYVCANCANTSLLANPNAFGNSSIVWISLLERGIPAVCPKCGLIYQVAKIISKSQYISPDIRHIAAGVCVGLLILAGVTYIEKAVVR